MPVLFWGDYAFMSKHPVKTPVRLAGEETLRLSGLLWPEARQRLADTAYATVESVGRGQIILFRHGPGTPLLAGGPTAAVPQCRPFGPRHGCFPAGALVNKREITCSKGPSAYWYSSQASYCFWESPTAFPTWVTLRRLLPPLVATRPGVHHP